MDESQPSQPHNTDSQYWTDLGLKYEAIYGGDVALSEIIQKYLNKLPHSASILECGSGTGKPIAKAIADSGRHYHGIDIAEGMISLSRKAAPSGTFEVADMLDYTTTSTYDGVIGSLSLFELSRQETVKMSHKWSQWLKPGGLLLINTMAAEDCHQVKAENYDADGECASVVWTFMGNKLKITLFTKAGWKSMLETARLEIVHTEEDLFKPAVEAGCDPEPRYYIIAKKTSNA